MQAILTPRLALVQTPLPVLQERLRHDSFDADVTIDGETRRVRFPAEWPGDALVLFLQMAAMMATDPDRVAWGGTVIERVEGVAVGQMGCKGFPDATGAVEIGYGINPAYWNRGIATEIVSAFAAWLLEKPDVNCVRAECRVDNAGSIRVLEKSGFARTGTRDDAEDGALLLWERRA